MAVATRPTISANIEVLESFLKLGASFFPVDVQFDPETGKATKHPLVRGWQEQASFPPLELGHHYAYGFHPETIDAIVVDLDNKGIDGEVELLKLIGGCDAISNPSVYVDTPNGRHVYFARGSIPAALRVSRNAIAPGVDIRGDFRGGWLVAPGSVGWSVKREEWQEYIPEGDFSNLPPFPPELAAYLSRFAVSDVAPSWIETQVGGYDTVEPQSESDRLLFTMARGLIRSPDGFAALVGSFVPGAKQIGASEWTTGDYEGNPGSSCHWSGDRGIIKDFNNPSYRGGDFIWWLVNFKHMNAGEAARAILREFHVPFFDAMSKEEETVMKAAAIAPVTGNFPFTDTGNAERLAESVRGRAIWSVDESKWLAWNGEIWESDESSVLIQTEVKRVLRAISMDADSSTDIGKAQLVWARKSEGRDRRNAMAELCKFEPGIAVSSNILDSEVDAICTKSGIVNLQTGTIEPFNKNRYFSKQCPYEVSFEPPETFLSFINQIMLQNKSLVRWVQVFLGHCLTGRTSEQIFPIFWGQGANGKSVLLDIIGSLMGPYCRKASADTWLQSRNERPVRDDLAALRGARFVWSAEPDASRRLSISTIKEMTGGEPITCRHLYGRPFTYTPQFKIVFVTNHRPQVKSQDNGTWRRLRFVPFTYTVPEAERVSDLAELLLLAEGPKILGWLIKGAVEWYAHRLPESPEINTATAELKEFDDPLAEFISARCILGSGTQVPFDQLWNTYITYCQERGGGQRDIIPRQLFRKFISDRAGLFIKSSRVFGIGIRESMQ